MRMQQKDTETAEKQTGWQSFIQGKGSKKKKVREGGRGSEPATGLSTLTRCGGGMASAFHTARC